MKYLISVLIITIIINEIISTDDTALNQQQLNFDLKLVNVDSTSSQLEIIDDNVTTINYIISYSLAGKYESVDSVNKPALIEKSFRTKRFEMQTNSMTLVKKQDDILKTKPDILDQGLDVIVKINNNNNKPDQETDSGERYNSEERMEISSKTYFQVHRFLIEDLEPNRFYECNFTIQARRAHLSTKLLNPNSNKEDFSMTTERIFEFKFKTTFDLDLTAQMACNNSISQEINEKQDLPLYVSSSCYVKDSNCSKCKPTCYEVKQIKNVKTAPKNDDSLMTKTLLASLKKPILCEACPCDTSRSTGECVTLDRTINSDNIEEYFQPQQIRCTKCKPPYTGQLCNECERDGIDYYKNEIGECVRCECNQNSAYDNMISSQTNTNQAKRRRCQAITGICIDCMFNTTGKHCDQCRDGYHGDAVKRTCAPVKIQPSSNKLITPNPNSNTRSRNTSSPNYVMTDLNEKYTSKKLALFSLYILCVLFLIILSYFCIKAKYNQSRFLKNGPSGSNASSSFCANLFQPFSNMASSLSNSTRHQRSRISFFFQSFCPKSFRSLNLSSTHNSGSGPTGIYNGTVVSTHDGLNCDDDRLNLAEYQVFDDSLFYEENNNIYRNTGNNNYNIIDQLSENDEVQTSNKNPYRSLTIKS